MDNPVGSEQASSSTRRNPQPGGARDRTTSKRRNWQDDKERLPRTYEMKALFDGQKKEEATRLSTMFLAALQCALSGNTSIDTPTAVETLQKHEAYKDFSRFLSWMFRHTDYLHSDGSLSIAEMMYAENYGRKFNRLKNFIITEGDRQLGCKIPETEIPKSFDTSKSGYNIAGVQAYVGMVNTILFNEKGRFEIGFCPEWSKRQLPTRYMPTPSPLDDTEVNAFNDFLPELPCDIWSSFAP